MVRLNKDIFLGVQMLSINHRRAALAAVLTSFLFVVACTEQSDTTPAPAAMPETTTGADTVFINGKVLTVDENFSEVEAVAGTGNEISAVGSTAEMSSTVSCS